ncbi:MAG: hypothetical protein ABR540_16175 [Acidimicrobiales bacterium]
MTLRGAVARLSVTGLLVFLLGGCQVTLSAGIDARPDGSGWVRAGLGLDAEALRELGDPNKELRLDDLRQAGWDVRGPEAEGDGLTWIRAGKRFETADEAAQVAAELSNADGPFREFRLERTKGFLRTRMKFTGLVDLSKGLAGINDPAVQERLGDADLGLDLAGLQHRFGADLDRGVRVRVEARLPGDMEAGPGVTRVGGGVAWQPAAGSSTRLEATSESWNLQPLLPAVAALAFAVAALVLALRGRR